jgi:plastocyanin
MGIKKFYERNKSIFVIGILMGAIFALLMIFYILKPKEETELFEINESEQEKYKVSYEEVEDNFVYETEVSDKPNVNEEVIDTVMNTKEVDEKFGVLEIEFSEVGFTPRTAKATIGQEVKWINKTERTIYFHQRRQTYSELEDIVEIAPGESFNFRMSVLGMWTYDEKESGRFGSIEVKEPQDVAVKNKSVNEEALESETNP